MENKNNLPDGLLRLIAEGTSDGIGIAVALFAQNNRIKIRPTSKSKFPLDDFIVLLTADYEKVKISYPFGEDSVKEVIDKVVQEYILGIELLFTDEDFEKVKKLVCTVVCGEVLEFLEPRKKQVEELFERIRNEGMGEPLPAGGPHG